MIYQGKMDFQMSSRELFYDFSSATVCHKDFVWNVQYNKPIHEQNDTERAAFVGAMIVGNSAVEFRHSPATAKAACFVKQKKLEGTICS